MAAPSPERIAEGLKRALNPLPDKEGLCLGHVLTVAVFIVGLAVYLLREVLT